jgi:hypothetical protein
MAAEPSEIPKTSRMNLIPKGIQRDLKHILGRLGLPKDTKPLYVGTQNNPEVTEAAIDHIAAPSNSLTAEEERLLEES